MTGSESEPNNWAAPLWWRICTWLGTLLITALALWPVAPGSPLPSDRWDHALAWAAMTIGFTTGRRHYGRALIALAMWGPVVEVLQGFTGRHPDGGDVLADWVGMLLAWGMLMMPPLSWVHRSWIKAVGPGTQAGSVPG